MNLAVGFNPRTIVNTNRRRVATLEMARRFSRRYATQQIHPTNPWAEAHG